jgi:hypothetical protein
MAGMLSHHVIEIVPDHEIIWRDNIVVSTESSLVLNLMEKQADPRAEETEYEWFEKSARRYLSAHWHTLTSRN